jgi:hypothetical protein
METALRPYAIHRDEGERLSFVGALTWIKATGAQTGGAFGLIEELWGPSCALSPEEPLLSLFHVSQDQ